MTIGSGTGSDPAGGVGPIERVRTGMPVVDAEGAQIGTVQDVVMGDPGADTTPESTAPSGIAYVGPPAGMPAGAPPLGLLDGIVDVGPELPEVERARLLRAGYVRINLKGLFSGHRFAASDEIADVEGDVVHLSVPSARLVG